MSEPLLKTPVFDVEELRVDTARGTRSYYRLNAPDWANIVPITPQGRVVLIRQHRWGTGESTLEIPGGMVDEGEDPADAVVRELREETGYGGGELIPLGWVHPNPAIMDNRCWLYAMRNARPVHETDMDDGEDIEIELVDGSTLSDLLGEGRITHALAVVSLQRVVARWPDVR